MMPQDAAKLSSSRMPSLIVVAASLSVMSLALLPGRFASAASFPPNAPIMANESSAANYGDLDCDDDIDVVDALLILRRVASLVAASGCGTSDVDCSGVTDAVDALALLREMARLSPLPVPDGCPGVDHGKVTPFVKIDRLNCEPAAVAVGQATDCFYSVGSSGADHELTWDFAGGSVTSGPGALSVVCPPDHLPCTYSSSGTYSVTFQTSGDSMITLTACAKGSCDSMTVIVAVAAVGARSGSQ